MKMSKNKTDLSNIDEDMIEDEDFEPEVQDLDEDVLITEDVFTKDEIFAGLKAPFDVKVTLQVVDKQTNKVRLKRGIMRLRIPSGLETGALLRKARNTSDVDFQDKVIFRCFVKPRFTTDDVQRLPLALKTKLLDVINARAGGLTITEFKKKQVDGFL